MILSNIKKIILFSISAVLVTGVSAESFRVRKMHTAEITENTPEITISSGINDATAIFLPEDKFFFEGLEIRMTIPESVALWPDTVGCTIYSSISPKPVQTQIDYNGKRSYVTTLPGRLSWVLQIPFEEASRLKPAKYTSVSDSVPDLTGNFVFWRLQTIMKGISEETMSAKIEMSIKPILKDIGLLTLNMTHPDNEENPVTVFIDDKLVDDKKPLPLTPGTHSISVISDYYRNEVRTVRIAQAKRTFVDIELRSVEPSLLITAPEGTSVFLDGNECKNIGKEFNIEMGEHTVKFVIGNYEITRVITVNKGKTYKANFSVDLEISENE